VSTVRSQSQLALQFFGVAALALFAAGVFAGGLMRVWPATSFPQASFPPVFGISTLLLFMGSASLSQALAAVRRERQVRFRRWLLLALCAGTLFVATQLTALNWLVRRQNPEEVQTGSSAFVAILAALHGVHFVVALLFLVFVTVRARADRYDHEYYFGVTVCAWFWHALGVAWLVVLGVMAMTGTAAEDGVRSEGDEPQVQQSGSQPSTLNPLPYSIPSPARTLSMKIGTPIIPPLKTSFCST
jgi:cytochrome c oxidase subunit 3